MRPPLALLAIALVGVGVTSCGDAASSGRVSSVAISGTSSNGGNLGGKHTITTASGVVYDGDDDPIRLYGLEANAADKRAITTLVRRYYAAAAVEDGTKGCALIDSLTVETIAEEEYEHLPGRRTKTCGGTLSRLFVQRHRELSRDNASLEVIGVRVEGDRALVLLRFAKARVPNHVTVSRKAAVWKMWELFATHMP